MIRAALIALAVVAALTGAATAAVPVMAQHLVRKTALYDVKVSYPHTGVATIDDAIATWARKQADDFTAYVKTDHAEGESPWSLAITYKIARNDAQMFEVLLSSQMADDGNHTHFGFTAFNYLMPDAHRVFIAEVVTPAAFAKMRAFAAAHMVADDPDFDAAVTEGALAPEAATFEGFAISQSAITMHFTPEQLGNETSAGGHAVIPLTEIKGLLRADWRAPQPSFDCARANGAVDKAICSDVALARLDRDMAAGYRQWLRWSENPAKVAEMKGMQRSWSASRGTLCAGSAPNAAMIACLMHAYQARIAYFKKPPV